MIFLTLSYILNFNEPKVDKNEVTCLANTLYVEARGESLIGKVAVAKVVLNRVDDSNFPDSICDVVQDPGEFPQASNKKSADLVWKKVQSLSEFIIKYNDIIVDPTNGALFFHTSNIKPYWAEEFEKVAKIDSHIFYK